MAVVVGSSRKRSIAMRENQAAAAPDLLHHASVGTVMNVDVPSTSTVVVLKPCPFCGDRAAVVHGDDGCFAVQCQGCKASTLPIKGSAEVAVCWWQLRLGTTSHFGGAATRGLRTTRKAKASRKNLERARAAKRFKQASATTPPLEAKAGQHVTPVKLQEGRPF
jgi:hypothetical protein